MKQENQNIPTYNKIKSSFHADVAQAERRSKQKMIIALVSLFVIACLLLTLITLFETKGAGRYVYIYGDSEQKISEDQAVYNDIVMIDFNALANYCAMTKTSLSPSPASFSINGTEAVFEDGSKTALINGIEKEMPTRALIQNGYCLIPLSTAKEILFGIEITADKKSVNINKLDGKLYIVDKAPSVEYITDVSAYLGSINSSDPFISTLVNKQTPIEEDFEPADLVIIPEAYSRKDKEIFLDKTALNALMAMMNDMNAQGITDIHVQSSYRSHAYQNMLFNMYIDEEMEENGLSLEEATAKANKYSARPEHSEHRTGLCVDFSTKSIGSAVDDIFETTEAFEWLKQNAWKYGFILRYPEDKIDITGYQYESWHYRFVGLEKASFIHQTGICYEEYLQIFN